MSAEGLQRSGPGVPAARRGKRLRRRRAALFDLATFFKTVANGRVISAYRPKQVIFAQGDPADTVLYIQSGRVKVTVVSDEGHEGVVAIQGSDEFLGEGCLIGHARRRMTAIAMTECEITKIDKTEVLRIIEDEPAFAQMFISHILARNARIEDDLVDHLFNSTEKRLARILLLLANFDAEGRSRPIKEKISQEMLAEMIGATRSRVCYFMNRFRQQGFIDYNGHLEVRSSLLNVIMGNRPRTS